ncbi:hypothetical protein HYFRA_00003063 [Hymenoscyphus fraxineus]|uniref:Uncharacterized protein n=1 Tax=Hymenoscyphus fraxineus TaxID=746836 RepID=A0A9N9KPB4_9HELO|nr:hypothetical protein HYFRA_00003063 [Hymenoscyphus fraxineus]
MAQYALVAIKYHAAASRATTPSLHQVGGTTIVAAPPPFAAVLETVIPPEGSLLHAVEQYIHDWYPVGSEATHILVCPFMPNPLYATMFRWGCFPGLYTTAALWVRLPEDYDGWSAVGDSGAGDGDVGASDYTASESEEDWGGMEDENEDEDEDENESEYEEEEEDEDEEEEEEE